ncbi:unnamed protein product [Closterium sp. Yama58-4]|nr:unnamed protein product [Closterium sp. Yama58-4]
MSYVRFTVRAHINVFTRVEFGKPSSSRSPAVPSVAAARPERGRRLAVDEPQVLATSVGRVGLLLQSSDDSRDRGVTASGATNPRRRNASEGVANVVNDVARVASNVPESAVAGTTACDVTKGRWTADPSLPLYDARSCPFIPKKFNCASNGRPDNEYEKWRWEVDGNGCTPPHPTRSTLCELLKNKRIIYIGDSIMENMFSSMACMAHRLLGAPDVTPGKVERSYSLHWSPCNITLTLIWSVFMVQTEWVDARDLFKGGQLDVSAPDSTWADVVPSYDVIVFNTGNWWKPRQVQRYGLTLNPPFHQTSIVEAYPHGLTTILTALHRRQRVTARAFLVTSVSFQFNASCPATQPIADMATARTTMAVLTRGKNEQLVTAIISSLMLQFSEAPRQKTSISSKLADAVPPSQ